LALEGYPDVCELFSYFKGNFLDVHIRPVQDNFQWYVRLHFFECEREFYFFLNLNGYLWYFLNALANVGPLTPIDWYFLWGHTEFLLLWSARLMAE